jgi:hypothetical protein
MDQAILEREALKLPSHERALLADALLVSLDDEVLRKTEGACADEAEMRHQAFVRGEIQALDGPTVFKQIRERHGK